MTGWGEMAWGEMARGGMGWKLLPAAESDPGSFNAPECNHWPWCQHLRDFQMDLGGKSSLWMLRMLKVLSGTAIQTGGCSVNPFLTPNWGSESTEPEDD